MDKRQLGRSGLTVAPWCFGGNVFGWTADESTSFRLLDAFVDSGFDFIDTADVYSRWAPGHEGGESETVIGRWLADRKCRDKVVIATKVGMDMGPGKDNLSRQHILQSVEDSLRRLQTDVIDLYQSHRDDPKTMMDETLEAHASLVKAGKVRALGASNFSAERLQTALDLSAHEHLPRYESLQPEYNLYSRSGFETALREVCVEADVGVIPYFSLAAGFLTGKYRSEADFAKSPRGGGMGKYLNERGLRILAALDEVAAQTKTTPAAVALAWLAAQPGVTAPIASATSVEQMAVLIDGAHLTLTADQLAALTRGERLTASGGACEPPLFCGVDGGGSNCRVRIRDSDGQIRAELVHGAANVYLAFDQAVTTIRTAVAAAVTAAACGPGPLRLGLGLAGVSSPAVAERVRQALQGLGEVVVASDAAIACLGAHDGEDGGLIVAGTGSGATAHIAGRMVSLGGRGFVLGDDGSGARLGLAAVRAALRAHDGLDAATPLTRQIMARFDDDPLAVITWGRSASSSAFAALAPDIVAAALAGDPAARPLVEASAGALAALAEALERRGARRLCLVGGLAGLLTPFLPEDLRAHLAPPRRDALDGALLLAGWRPADG